MSQTYSSNRNGKEGEEYITFHCFPSSTKDGSGARESFAFRSQGSLLRSPRTLHWLASTFPAKFVLDSSYVTWLRIEGGRR